MLALQVPTIDLNAVLIKELRQELRVRGFVWSFIGFHIAMILFTLASFAAQDLQRDFDFMLSISWFWAMLAIPLFIAAPMRGFTAFRKEASAKELELIFLTRTSSWHIAFYKWVALCLQGVLLLTAALPYVIVRYVVGSLDLIDAFVAMGILLLATMLLTAGALVISAQNMHRPRFSFFRVIIALVIGLPFANQVIVFAFYGFSHLGPVSFTTGANTLVVLVSALLLLLLLLEFAASHIASRAENHAAIKRLLGVLTLATGALFHALGIGEPWFVYTGVGLYLLVICITALCEAPTYVQSIYAPLVRGGAWKRCLGLWLYPGWSSAVVYTISMCLLFYAAMAWMHHEPFVKMVLGGGALAAGLCLPLVFTHLLWPSLRQKWWAYLLIQAALFIISFFIVREAPRHACSALETTDYIVSLLPLSALTRVFEPRRFCPVNEATALAAIGIFLLLALPWLRVWRQVRDTERRTRAALEEQPQHV